jgi:hypothetical protein
MAHWREYAESVADPWWALLKLARPLYVNVMRQSLEPRRYAVDPAVYAAAKAWTVAQTIRWQGWKTAQRVCSACCQSASKLWRGMFRVLAGCKTCAAPRFESSGTWAWDTYSSTNTVLER